MLTREQLEALEKLKTILSAELKAELKKDLPIPEIKKDLSKVDAKEIKKIAAAPKKPMKKEEATSAIQHFWRMSKIKKQFYSNFHFEHYLAMILSTSDNEKKVHNEINGLGSLMFGKTIAAFFSPSEDFPYNNPDTGWVNEYHRVNIFNHKKDIPKNLLPLRVLRDFEPKIDLNNYEYIPITLAENTPATTVLKDHFDEFKDSLQILYKEKSKIAFIKSYIHCNRNKIKRGNLSAIGLTASPLQLAKYYTEHHLAKMPDVDKKQLNVSLFKTMQNIQAPKSIADLLKDKTIKKLLKIAERKNATGILAECIYNLLNYFIRHDLNAETIKRIYIFLNIGIHFYSLNYARFATIVYAVTHELSMYIASQKNYQAIVDYQQFKKEVKDNAISNFNLGTDELKSSQIVAAPANSGSAAFITALALASKMKISSEKPIIRVIAPFYFEFQDFITSSDDVNADIYVMSLGPMKENRYLMPGSDINKIIEMRMKSSEKPFTLIIDSTSGLYKNLRLSKENQAYVIKGLVSIIVCESHQKFGLLHTDQAQYGRVFGICSKNSFAESILNTFEKNAASDLNNIPDMIIGSLIDITCGPNLEKIKQNHFANGDIYRRMFKKFGWKTNAPLLNEFSISSENEILFNLIHVDSELASAMKKSITSRSSFAHFNSTLVDIEKDYRISASAAESSEIINEICKMYLNFHFSHEEIESIVFNSIQAFEKGGSFTEEEKIIFFATIDILKPRSNLKNVNAFEHSTYQMLSTIDKIINHYYDEMNGTNRYNKLLQKYYYHLTLSVSEGFTAADILNHLNYLDNNKMDNSSFLSLLRECNTMKHAVNKLSPSSEDQRNYHIIIARLIMALNKYNLVDSNQAMSNADKKGDQIEVSPNTIQVDFKLNMHLPFIALNRIKLLTPDIIPKLVKHIHTSKVMTRIHHLYFLGKINKKVLEFLIDFPETHYPINQLLDNVSFLNNGNVLRALYSELSKEPKSLDQANQFANFILKLDQEKLVIDPFINLTAPRDYSKLMQYPAKIAYLFLIEDAKDLKNCLGKWSTEEIRNISSYLKSQSEFITENKINIESMLLYCREAELIKAAEINDLAKFEELINQYSEFLGSQIIFKYVEKLQFIIKDLQSFDAVTRNKFLTYIVPIMIKEPSIDPFDTDFLIPLDLISTHKDICKHFEGSPTESNYIKKLVDLISLKMKDSKEPPDELYDLHKLIKQHRYDLLTFPIKSERIIKELLRNNNHELYSELFFLDPTYRQLQFFDENLKFYENLNYIGPILEKIRKMDFGRPVFTELVRFSMQSLKASPLLPLLTDLKSRYGKHSDSINTILNTLMAQLIREDNPRVTSKFEDKQEQNNVLHQSPDTFFSSPQPTSQTDKIPSTPSVITPKKQQDS